MEVVRTPDERFAGLMEYAFQPHYVEIPNGAISGSGTLRVHFLDEGPRDAAETILCMHGQPSWSYLYRRMVPLLVAAGHRVLCPDLVGFGRSDKPTQRSDYTYEAHTRWMEAWLQAVDPRHVTLVCQDWGGLIGLRLAAAHQDRFVRIVAANTALPAGMVPGCLAGPIRRGYEMMPVPDVREVVTAIAEKRGPSALTLLRMVLCRQAPAPSETLGFLFWIKWCSEAPDMTPREVFKVLSQGLGGNPAGMSEEVLDGYGAPFPEEAKERYIAGARQFPSLVPIFQDGGFQGQARDVEVNKETWRLLERWEKPFLCAFSDGDPVTRGGHRAFRERVPGAQTIKHVTIKGAGHFLQEDKPEELAAAVLEFIAGKRQIAAGSVQRRASPWASRRTRGALLVALALVLLVARRRQMLRR